MTLKRAEYADALRALPPDAVAAYLSANSGLPGPRSNLTLLDAAGDVLSSELARAFIADEDEYLASCGTVSLGRLLLDGDRGLIGTLTTLAADGRWRVRESVAIAAQRVGDEDAALLRELVATWTAHPDPLVVRAGIAAICARENIHFHADAAWGGPTLMSDRYKHLLDGIQLADSVTIDGHKQFYMPMGCGMIYFKNPWGLDAISYHANYVNRRGSVDLGIRTLAGSREANCLILDSAIKIMGTRGYGMLIEHGIELAAAFAEEIENRPLFQLTTRPELNILTYRVCPPELQAEMKTASAQRIDEINDELNELNRTIQQEQREAGKSFVSRTVLEQDTIFPGMPPGKIVVLRSVLMNPLTNIEILKDILDEQECLYELWRLGEIGLEKTRKDRK